MKASSSPRDPEMVLLGVAPKVTGTRFHVLGGAGEHGAGRLSL